MDSKAGSCFSLVLKLPKWKTIIIHRKINKVDRIKVNCKLVGHLFGKCDRKHVEMLLNIRQSCTILHFIGGFYVAPEKR